jgi:hypothetical protein
MIEPSLGTASVKVAEVDGYVVAAGDAQVALFKVQEYAKSLPGRWWVETAADWYLQGYLEGFVVGFASSVQRNVTSLAEARVYLMQHNIAATAIATATTEIAEGGEGGEVILEPVAGVEPQLPKRSGTKIALFLCALSGGATEAELKEIIGKNKATVRQFINYACHTSAKSYGCRLLNGRFYLVQP